MIDRIEYRIFLQTDEDEKGVLRKGKKIRAYLGGRFVGKAGFVEWNRDEFKDGLNTAALRLDEGGFAIEVKEPYRKKGVGKSLLATVLDEAGRAGFERFIIPGVIMRKDVESKKGFYDHVLEHMLSAGEILYYECLRDGRPLYSEYTYDLFLKKFRKKRI